MATRIRVVGGAADSDDAAGGAGGASAAVTGGDAEPVDAEPVDAELVDGPVDAELVDGPADAELVDGAVTAPPTKKKERKGESARRRRSGRAVTTPDGRGATRRRRAGFVALLLVAVLGVAGTVGFGVAWAGLNGRQTAESHARTAARSFLVDLTNFDSKTVDADFNAITGMATGTFASQAQKFFNSSIRQDLEKALASSRGEIRDIFVQSYSGNQASVYAVVDQLYVNDKIASPQTDTLRIVVSMEQVSGTWKVADVTVLQGPSLGSGTSASSPSATTASSSSTSPSTPSSSSTSPSSSSTSPSTTAPAG